MASWGVVGIGVLCAVVTGACGGMVADGPQTLARASALADAQGCTAIETGSDTDADGVLADDEVALSAQVCKPPADAVAVPCPGGKSHAGNVVIHDSADWAQLADLTCIDGDLLIVGTEEPELQALGTLTTVTGNVVIAGNPGFTTLAGLAGVRTIGGVLLVQGNDGLADLQGAGAVAGLRELAVVGNAHLPDLTGLEAFGCSTSLVVAENPELASLHGLEDHACIGPLELRSNAALASLDALDALTTAEALSLDGNRALAAPGLRALATVRGELYIANEPFAHLELPALAAVGALDVESNGALETLALPLTGAGAVDVLYNPKLTLIDLAQLASANRLTIRANPALGAIRASFGSLDTLELVGNRALADVRLGELTEMGGDFTVEYTAGSIDALDSLAKIGGSLTLHGAVPVAAERAFAKRVEVGRTISVD